ncbi:MAG: VPLPA-CTERM-specific exosortase XrtD [Pseudomonadota bacterium]|nr:VPLPA-CTERM-specific exosortase XrtD [Pseudomonadota bacterium]
MAVNSLDHGATSGFVWRLSWGPVLLATAIVGLSLWLFWDGLWLLASGWTGSPEYSHCVLIPPIAAFLIWQQKARLELTPFEGSWWGVGLVLLGGGLLVLGQLATVFTLVQYAYLVTLYGLVLAFTGRHAFRMIRVPLLILVFMIPLPAFFLYNLSTKLQLVSSDLGVWFMRLFGISVFVQGNVIDLGSYQLQVAEACDGLRYLFPLMTLSFLMAYFYKGATWKRIVLFLSSIPITIVMNSGRIGMIGLMVEHWGIGMAEGFLHQFQGWMVFMLSMGLLLGEIALLNRVGHESGTWRELFGVEFPAPTPPGAALRRRKLPLTFAAASGVLVLFVAIAWVLPRPREVLPSRATFVEFPMHLGAWTGHMGSLERVYLDQLKLDDYLLADYTEPAGRSINLYMAYYNSQRKGEAVHSPRSCLPGGGWQFREFDQRVLPEARLNGRALRVNRTLIELGNQRALMYYWFQQRGRVITNEFEVKWYLFWDAVTRHRTDGALVRVITSVPLGSDAREADRELTRFASRIAADLPRYVPN